MEEEQQDIPQALQIGVWRLWTVCSKICRYSSVAWALCEAIGRPATIKSHIIQDAIHRLDLLKCPRYDSSSEMLHIGLSWSMHSLGRRATVKYASGSIYCKEEH